MVDANKEIILIDDGSTDNSLQSFPITPHNTQTFVYSLKQIKGFLLLEILVLSKHKGIIFTLLMPMIFWFTATIPA